MISFINNALKHRNGEKGFSLVELIVVVAILGILVVIAIPVFGAIQETARHNTVKTAAANAATSLAAQVTASGPSAVQPAIEKLNSQNPSELRYSAGGGTQIESVTGGTINVPAVQASMDSTDTIYVYAVNNRGEWAGAGSAGAASQSWPR
ncbi:type II secretion system protein [Microbacterium sp. Leaf151]|uniref:type II secretion system protein n=1 Tax=Microbacterium sp. Leaf151 TaxID=1736276 RepID=UPI0009E8A0B5|nr:prepilin-type N-terminal cleavage/methylation domain-containing protein [Microbacterium sp. Leaf151]